MIYFITTIRVKVIKGKSGFDASRTVGYLNDKETARQLVEDNWGELDSGNFYDYCVIESIGPGIYKFNFDKKDNLWYHWDRKDSKWEKCKEPEFADKVCNFAIG